MRYLSLEILHGVCSSFHLYFNYCLFENTNIWNLEKCEYLHTREKTHLFLVTIVLGRIHVNPNTRRSLWGKKPSKQRTNTPSKSI